MPLSSETVLKVCDKKKCKCGRHGGRSNEFSIKTGNEGTDSQVIDKVRKSWPNRGIGVAQMTHKYHEPKCTSLLQTKNNKSHPLLKPSLHLIIAVLRKSRVYHLPECFLITSRTQARIWGTARKWHFYSTTFIQLCISTNIQWMTQHDFILR